MRFSVVVAAMVALAAIVPTHPAAAKLKRLGRFGSWVVAQKGAGEYRSCVVYGEPKRRKGRYSHRGPTMAEIQHIPQIDLRNEVMIVAGYRYEPDASVRVSIDGRKFVLPTDVDRAWIPGSKAGRALVQAMRRGSTMIVRGRSRRGTLTTDTYSLSGFTAAHKRSLSACGMR